jgi:KipI family sensor histidine kinase inhibitor
VIDFTPRIGRLGEHVWLVELGSTVDEHVNRRVLALAAWIRAQAWPGVRDVVPAFASLAIHLAPTANAADVESRLRERLSLPLETEVRGARRTVDIPVRYGGTSGPDLDDVAALVGLTARDVVERHATRTYNVFMLGFLPGFAYLGIVDEAIQVPRHTSPRIRVPAGSVGLAGAQTGIYPRESPGGWRIIGRSALTLFDASAPVPSLLQPGDRVRFVPEAIES